MKESKQNLNVILNEWLALHNYSQCFILVDEHTKNYCLPLLKLNQNLIVIEIASGEEFKNITTCQFVWSKLLENQADRNSLLINLGGGVICDMGAFSAACYKRGIAFMQIPTTLLAMVDAAYGGKTGVDFLDQKNMIGLFANAQEVFIEPIFLKTLPQNELLSGFAEVLKHGLIQNSVYFYESIAQFKQKKIDWLSVIHNSIAIKQAIVDIDPNEKGIRKILNFGHTIGHAIETWSLQNETQPLLHGEAIAIGMICEAWLSNAVNGLPADELEEITHTFIQLFGKYPLEKIPFTAIMDVMQQDKKNSNKTIRFSLLHTIGNCDYDIQVSDALIAEALTYYCTIS